MASSAACGLTAAARRALKRPEAASADGGCREIFQSGTGEPATGRNSYLGGSKYPIFMDSGPRSPSGYGFWGHSPQIFGTWTLWDRVVGDPRFRRFPGPLSFHWRLVGPIWGVMGAYFGV